MPIMVEIRYSSPRGIPAGYNPASVSTKLRNIAQAVVRQHKEDINRNYYANRQASLPGEFPKRRTGNLRNSVYYTVNGAANGALNAGVFKKAKQLKIGLGYNKSVITHPAKANALRNGRIWPPMQPRQMMPSTAQSVIPIELAKNNPEPWTPTAEWRPLTWEVIPTP